MKPVQWRKARDLFDAALEMEPEARRRFLAEACADDLELHRQVEQLLLDKDHDDFLERPLLLNASQLALADESRRLIGQQIDDYHILRELGRGGMSVVFLAERADYKQQVAIKLLWPGVTTPETVWRFNQERRILARLTHPNIARLLDGGVTSEGWQYVVMEYIAGQRITEYCHERHSDAGRRLKLFQQVCAAVEYAHTRLIVHRDLKPSNILVTEEGQIKLLDFGIAKLLDPSLLEVPEAEAAMRSRTGLQPMTPEYASPEQIRSEQITTASDIYTLGVLLYELLTGIHPHVQKNLSLPELMRRICEEEPVRPSTAAMQRYSDSVTRRAGNPLPEEERDANTAGNPGFAGSPNHRIAASQLRGDLDNIVLKALRKEPQHRYASVSDFSQDITRHLNGEPVIARTPTLAYRFSRYVTRHKIGVAMTAFVALTMLTAAGYFLRQSQIAQARVREQQRELYAADMRQAGSDWHEGNLMQMDQLLERHRPGNGIDDEWRGFEWFALWKLLHREKFTLHHQFPVPTVVFSSDGQSILTGVVAGAGELARWNAQDGRHEGSFSARVERIFQMRRFKTGTRLIVNHSPGRLISIWDYQQQRKLTELSLSGSRDHGFISFSPDEAKLVTSGYDLPVQVWDTTTGRLLETFAPPDGFELPPAGPAIYAPDGRLLCLVKKGRYFELWDFAAHRSIVRLDPDSDDPRALITFDPIGQFFSPDGKRYYLVTQDFRIRVWDFKAGGKPLLVFTGHTDQIEIPALSPDGRLLASGSDDRTLRLWDTQTGRLLVTALNESQTFSPAFSPDGRQLAAVSMRAFRTKVWDVQPLLTTNQFFEGIETSAVSPDGKMILTEGDPENKISPGSHQITTLRDLDTGRKIQIYDARSYCVGLDCTQFSADGKLVILRNRLTDLTSSNVRVLETATGKLLAELNGHIGNVNAIAFSPHGKTLATGGDNDLLIKIKLWDATTWQEKAVLQNASQQNASQRISSLNFSSDGKKLVSSDQAGEIKVWDVVAGKELTTLSGHKNRIWKVRFSPDGKWIASASWDFTIKLWEAATGREVHTLRGHANSVYALAFSPDGRRLASGGDDRTVRLWDLQTGVQLTALYGHTGKVWQVFFTSDGNTLISSGEDGTRIWRTATVEEVQARNRR